MFKKIKIDDSRVMKFGFLGGIFEATYCLGVVSLIKILERELPKVGAEFNGFLLILIIFVVSAGVSGLLLFGYPAYLALQKRFAEAVMTAVTSLLTLVIIGILVFVWLSIIQ